MKTKAELRRESLFARKNMPSDEIHEKSRIIVKSLTGLQQYIAASHIMCYVDFKNEVVTKELIEYSLLVGKRISVPVVADKVATGRALIASEIKSFKEDLSEGAYGILEPPADRIRITDPLSIDMVVVPGVLFSRQRHRIGYGAGYYDRFLRLLRKDCYIIGICFDVQLYDIIPFEEHDIPMDLIITETGIV